MAVQATCRRPVNRPYRTAGRKAEHGRFSVLQRPEIHRNLRIKDSVKIDLGCGSGRDSKHFLENGFIAVPVDGSPEMCKFAETFHGAPVRCILFSKLDYKKEFDGIWACASLLHVLKKNMDTVMRKVERALMPYGVLYASFKYGEGENDTDGRHFSYYNDYDLDSLTDLKLIEYWVSDDVRPDHANEKWLNTLWRSI